MQIMFAIKIKNLFNKLNNINILEKQKFCIEVFIIYFLFKVLI